MSLNQFLNPETKNAQWSNLYCNSISTNSINTEGSGNINISSSDLLTIETLGDQNLNILANKRLNLGPLAEFTQSTSDISETFVVNGVSNYMTTTATGTSIAPGAKVSLTLSGNDHIQEFNARAQVSVAKYSGNGTPYAYIESLNPGAGTGSIALTNLHSADTVDASVTLSLLLC